MRKFTYFLLTVLRKRNAVFIRIMHSYYYSLSLSDSWFSNNLVLVLRYYFVLLASLLPRNCWRIPGVLTVGVGMIFRLRSKNWWKATKTIKFKISLYAICIFRKGICGVEWSLGQSPQNLKLKSFREFCVKKITLQSVSYRKNWNSRMYYLFHLLPRLYGINSKYADFLSFWLFTLVRRSYDDLLLSLIGNTDRRRKYNV